MLTFPSIHTSVSCNVIWKKKNNWKKNHENVWSANQISLCDLPSLFDIHTSVSCYLNIKKDYWKKKNTWKMCQLLKLWECLYKECGTLPFSDKSWINPRWSQGISPVISATCPKNQRKIVHEIVHFIDMYLQSIFERYLKFPLSLKNLRERPLMMSYFRGGGRLKWPQNIGH